MKLTRLEVIETTENYILFKIEVEVGKETFFTNKRIETYDCVRKKGQSYSNFLHNGDSIFRKWVYLDDAINTLLERKYKTYNGL